VKAKLTEMRRYILWRDSVVKPGGDGSNQHQRAILPNERELLPTGDPGFRTAYRWRKALKAIEAFETAITDAQMRCRRICEQENLSTIRGTEGGDRSKHAERGTCSIRRRLRQARKCPGTRTFLADAWDHAFV
jgi:hypothetical protein